MAFTASERSICNKMVFDFDAVIAPIRAGKAAVRSATSDLSGLLNSTSFASENVINQAISDFLSDVNSNLPDTTQLAEIAHLIDNCAYLKDNFDTGGIIASSINSAVGKIDQLLNNVGTTLPEFNMGKLASSINDLLFGNIPGSGVISSLFQAADKLIDCVSAYCGGEYPSQVSSFTQTMNELYEDMNIISDPIDPNYGKYDMEYLYNQAGVGVADQAKVTNVIAAADSSKNLALSKINSVFTALKGA